MEHHRLLSVVRLQGVVEEGTLSLEKALDLGLDALKQSWEIEALLRVLASENQQSLSVWAVLRGAPEVQAGRLRCLLRTVAKLEGR